MFAYLAWHRGAGRSQGEGAICFPAHWQCLPLERKLCKNGASVVFPLHLHSRTQSLNHKCAQQAVKVSETYATQAGAGEARALAAHLGCRKDPC